MDMRFGGNGHPKGRGPGPDRRANRAGRNMTLKNGAGEASGKFRNKSWRREDGKPQDNAQQESTVDANRNNGFKQPTQMNNDSAVASGSGGSGSPFGQSVFSASAFGQSAFSPPTSVFSTTPASSPPRRNAFGALIDPEPGHAVLASGSTTTSSQPQASISQSGVFSQAISAFASPSPFGTASTSVSAFQSPKRSAFNPEATEFKPASAFATFGSTPTPPLPSSIFGIKSGSTPTTSFGNVQSAFSATTSFPVASQNTPKSAFATSHFTPSHLPPPAINGIKSAFGKPQENKFAQGSTNVAPMSASAREGGHISTSRFRFKRIHPWKKQRSSKTLNDRPPFPKQAPLYRIPPNIQREIDQGHYATDNRFPGNRFLELKALRPSMRAHSIKHKLISDPEHRTDLTGAITVVGTCMEMCPEFERHEREFQKDVDDWEKIPGTNPKRIDHTRAVKKYRRSAAGNDEPLESDLRPPVVLKMTLDYLIYELLAKHGLEATYAFIRDRTRAIRTDFTIQHEKGPIAVECFERIARFHILAVHRFCERDDVRGFDYWQEVEQMMKTLQSLIQFYDDNEGKFDSPNEAEFRSYYILAHIRDTNSVRRLQALAPRVFLDPVLQTAIEFRSYAQRNTHVERRSGHRAAKLKFKNSEACMNAFTRLFKRVKNEGTSYLMACLLEYHFGGVRKGAIHSLWKAYTARHRPMPTADLMELLALDDEIKTLDIARRFGMASVEDADAGGAVAVQLNKNSRFDHTIHMSQRHSLRLVETKRGDISDVDIVDGRFEKAGKTWTLSEPDAAMPIPVTSASADSFEQIRRKPSLVKTVAPETSSTPVPFLGPTSSTLSSTNRSVFDHEVKAPNASGIYEPATLPSQVQKVPQPAPVTFARTTPAALFAAPAPPTLPASWPSEPAAAPSSSGFIPSVSREEAVVTPPISKPQEVAPLPTPQPSQPVEEDNSHSPSQVVAEESEPPPPLQLDTNIDAPLSVPYRPPSPPRLTQEELLYEQKQAALRASALARAKADRHFKSRILFITFSHWKRRVVNIEHVRALREDRKAQFRRSILSMGLSNNSPVDDRKGKGKQKAVYTEEDLVPWEDTSQASSSTSPRKRRRKSVKRADDDATLAAIKEAETTRAKLWERGSFLASVIRRVRGHLSCRGTALPHGWQVWLSTSTTAENASTAEWLRAKFSASESTSSSEAPGLDRISLSNAAMPPGHIPTAGIIVFDLSTSATESAVRSDCQRLLNVISLLPSNRHYIPSVLLLHWTEFTNAFDPMYSLLDGLQRENKIDSWRIVSFSNDGQQFDDQFHARITDLSLDLVGKLVEMISIDDVYRMFFQPWVTALDRGINVCQSHQSDDFDWVLYGKVLAVMLDYINHLAVGVLHTCNLSSSAESLLAFDGSSIFDQRSAFEAVMKYLSTGWLASNQDALLLRAELSADLFAGRAFYVRAVPERLVHLVIRILRAPVPPDSKFFLDKNHIPETVASFTAAIHASLAQLEHRSPSLFSKKRTASEDAESLRSSEHSTPLMTKRRKTESPPASVNGDSSPPTASNDKLHVEDRLTRLRNSVARARRSMDDLRFQRDFEQRSLSPPAESDIWTSAGSSPGRLSSASPAPNGRTLSNGRGPSLFSPQTIDLPLIPRDAFELIPAKPAHTLTPSLCHQTRSQSPAKTARNGPLMRFHPYLNGRERDHSTKSFPARVHDGMSLGAPGGSDQEGKHPTGSLKSLRINLQRAQLAVEASRRSREASNEV